MKTSPKGVEFIAAWETLSLKPYQCSAGKWTIGFGHTKDVSPSSLELTREDALALLSHDVREAEEAVNSLRLGLPQHQYDALVSLAFHVGCHAVRTSTAARRIGAGDVKGAADAFMLFLFCEGEPMLGFFKRRIAERRMFLKGVYDASH